MLLCCASSRRLGCYRARSGRGAPRARGEARPLVCGTPQWNGRGGCGQGAVTRVGQGIDALELLIDGPGEGEGVEAIALPPQGGGQLRAEIRAGEQAFQRGAGAIVAAAHASADPLFALQLDGGQEEVLEQPQL